MPGRKLPPEEQAAAQKHLLPGSKTWQNSTVEPTRINTLKHDREPLPLPSSCTIHAAGGVGEVTFLSAENHQPGKSHLYIAVEPLVPLKGPLRTLQVSDKSSKLDYNLIGRQYKQLTLKANPPNCTAQIYCKCD